MYDVLNAYLENGLKVILHKIPGVKTIACGLWVCQGSAYETDANNGFSHLAEHLLLNPKDASNQEYRQWMDKIASEGVLYNAATTKEYTCYHFTGLESTLPLCLSCLACIAKEDREFSEDFFENEKKVVLQEATSFYSSYQQIKERTSQAIWGNRGIGKIIMGDLQNVARANQQEVIRLIQDAYVPENSTVIVVGSINYQETLFMIEERFGQWKDIKSRILEVPVENVPGVYINKGSGSSAVLSIGFRAPAYHTAERPAAEMLARMLGGGGMDSRMAQEIRIKRGLSYTFGGFASLYKNRGTLGFMSVCDKEKITEVAKVLMDIFMEVKDRGFREEEIQREKNIMETSVLLAVDNITEHLRYIGKCSSMDKNFYIENEVRSIRNIDKKDIEQATNAILQECNMGMAAIGECDVDALLDIVSFS